MNYTKPDDQTVSEAVKCTGCKEEIGKKEGFYSCEKDKEYYHEGCVKGNIFTQTYSLAMMSKSKLFVKIMEY